MAATIPLEVKVPEFEIVGLHHNSNGRSCCQHTTCGMSVVVGDVLRLVHVVLQIREGSPPEDAIKMIKIMDGVEGCCVGFVPRPYAKLQRIRDKIGTFCIVTELYDNSINIFKRRMSHRNYGVAACIFLNDIPSFE
jgi:hypothetical protein